MKRLFSIVVPIYQNEANIPGTITRLLALEDQLPGYDLELVFVDDGSTDNSYRLLEQYAAQYADKIKLVKLTRNFGQTPAVQAGLHYAAGDCVGVISSDLQEPCEMFIDMLQAWEQGAMFVIGERQERPESQFYQRMSSIYWNIVRYFALPDFPKKGYDFCLLDRQVVEDINHINEKNSSIFVLIYWLGYKPVCIPIKREIRKKGESQWKLWNKIRFTIDTIIGFTYLPTRFISLVGLTMALLSVLYFCVMLFLWFWLEASPAGWMSVIGVLSLVGSMTLFSLGIMSEYLLRILDESRRRPPYVVEKFIKNNPEKANKSEKK